MFNNLLLFSESSILPSGLSKVLDGIFSVHSITCVSKLAQMDELRRKNEYAVILILLPVDKQLRYQLLNLIRNVKGKLKSPYLLLCPAALLAASDHSYFAGDPFVLQLPEQEDVLLLRMQKRINDRQLFGDGLKSSAVECRLKKAAQIRFTEDAEVSLMNEEAVQLSEWVFGESASPEQLWSLKVTPLIERGKQYEGEFTLNEVPYQLSYRPQSTGGLLEIKHLSDTHEK